MRFARLGQFLVHRARWVTVAGLVFFLAAAGFGADVATKLSSGGFGDPDAESSKAQDLLADTFRTGEPNVVLVVRPAEGGTVDDPEVVEAGTALTDELASEEGVTTSVSYWSVGSAPPLRADDGESALVLARVEGSQDEVRERIEEISPAFTRDGPVVTVEVGGQAEVFRQVGETIEADLRLAEMIALPITLLLLLLIFRSVPAALLPIGVGGFAIVTTFSVLEVLASATTVSIFALNLTTAMGLGLAIDYSLFIVSRYREERDGGCDSRAAVVRTVATAGRAVVFSGLTVAASLAALLVFPIAFLRSFAYAGIPVVAMALVGAVVILPAALVLLGDRIDRWSLPRRSAPVVTGAFWERLARGVMRRPIPVATATIALLLVLGAPFLHIAFGLPDDRVLPESASSRQVSEEVRDAYSSNDAGAISVVFPELEPIGEAKLTSAAIQLSALEGVGRADTATGVFIDGVRLADPPGAERFLSTEGGALSGWVSVVPEIEPVSAEGEELVEQIRSLELEADVVVGGVSAQLVDTKEALFDRLPLAVGIVVGVIFVLLFLMFGSVVVPAKAIVLNLLSLTATFGAMVWIFQDGNMAGVLDFTPTGMLDTTTPILMFCVAFGLSMDYEVFLLSRIKEEYDRTGDNTESVALGLARTGRIITAAAAVISVVFLAFATSNITFIKLFGIGLTLAVVMDATLVRATLVPAFMRLAGRANWWAPSWLRRVYDRFGLGEAEAAIADLDVVDLREPTRAGGS